MRIYFAISTKRRSMRDRSDSRHLHRHGIDPVFYILDDVRLPALFSDGDDRLSFQLPEGQDGSLSTHWVFHKSRRWDSLQSWTIARRGVAASLDTNAG